MQNLGGGSEAGGGGEGEGRKQDVLWEMCNGEWNIKVA